MRGDTKEGTFLNVNFTVRSRCEGTMRRASRLPQPSIARIRVSYSQVLDNGGLAVGNDVEITLDSK